MVESITFDRFFVSPIWGMYEPDKSEVITQSLPMAHHRFGHNGSYSHNFKFPSLDSESPQKMGLDTFRTGQIGGGQISIYKSGCVICLLWLSQAQHSHGNTKFEISSKKRSC